MRNLLNTYYAFIYKIHTFSLILRGYSVFLSQVGACKLLYLKTQSLAIISKSANSKTSFYRFPLGLSTSTTLAWRTWTSNLVSTALLWPYLVLFLLLSESVPACLSSVKDAVCWQNPFHQFPFPPPLPKFQLKSFNHSPPGLEDRE